MNRRRPLLTLAAVTLAGLSGCGVAGRSVSADPGTGAPAAESPTAASRLGDSVKEAGDIPDPCTLLSDEQVTELTGRDITQTDTDGQAAGDATRYCQWQQSGGQLAVFLARTTADDFATSGTEGTPVNDLGDSAFQLAGHLYVLYGTMSIDVYSHGDGEDENLTEATAVAEAIIPQI